MSTLCSIDAIYSFGCVLNLSYLLFHGKSFASTLC